jgi:hypothetical protein
MGNWKYYEDVDFSDENNLQFNIDTRDFYCLARTVDELLVNGQGNILDTSLIDKSPAEEYYHTEDELKYLIQRFVKESGGDGEWRKLSLVSDNKNVNFWNLKYLIITRLKKGFLVCNRENYILSKSVLSSPIEKRYLNHVTDKIYNR